MPDTFNRKIFTIKTLLRDLGYLFMGMPMIMAARRNTRISTAFVEKIMTVVTAVYGCIYCRWFHARQAVSCGISKEEVKNLLDLQFQARASDFEITALLYAQHYAETNRKPDHEMTTRLFDTYGKKTAKHIILFIRMIFFGNLAGNTWDAVISRFKGKPAENSSILFEIFYFLLTFWIMFPLMIIAREKKQ